MGSPGGCKVLSAGEACKAIFLSTPGSKKKEALIALGSHHERNMNYRACGTPPWVFHVDGFTIDKQRTDALEEPLQ